MTNPQSELALPRLAAIDIGTNSMRLVVAEVAGDSTYRVLDEEREMTRLGEGFAESGRLSDAAMERSLTALGSMKAIAGGFQVTELRAIATSAVREATNGRQFLREAWRRHRVRIDVITGEEEARLAFQSAARHFKLDGGSTAIVDIGGGSVEVIHAAGTVVEQVHSLRLGAVRLTEQLVRSDPLKKRHWKTMRKAIDRTIKAAIRPPFRAEMMIGSGGTFTNIGEIVRSQREGKAGNAHGYLVTRSELVYTLKRLRALPLEARRQVPGLNPSRADIILAGAAVVARLAKRLGTERILVNERGIREGILLSMIAELPGTPVPTRPEPVDRMEWVRIFARKCRSNERHCEHVASLAVQLFDGLRSGFGLPAASREILQAAAILHDIGYLINHARHHRHAYHLIMHGELPEFSPRDVELIANVVRYHRRAYPKKSHENLARLDRSDRRLVSRLAGLLRVADGLDRAHTQTVRSARIRVRDGRARLQLEAAALPELEIRDAEQKAGLFEKAFDVRLRFEWAAPDGARVAALPRPAKSARREA